MHKTLLTLAFLVLAMASRTLAGQLDVAVIQFPEKKTVEELDSALAGVQLAKIADADRTQTKVAYLQAAYVRALVSIAVPRGTYFSTSTRLGVFRSELSGRLGEKNIQGSITVIEGVKGGIRSYMKYVYALQGALPTGPARVMTYGESHGKLTKVTKDMVTTTHYNYTTVVIAQYTK